MTKTLVITAIVLVAVIMGFSAIAPALATHGTPLVLALNCRTTQSNLTCVAIDRDEDGVCDSDVRSVIQTAAAQRLGILDRSCT